MFLFKKLSKNKTIDTLEKKISLTLEKTHTENLTELFNNYPDEFLELILSDKLILSRLPTEIICMTQQLLIDNFDKISKFCDVTFDSKLTKELVNIDNCLEENALKVFKNTNLPFIDFYKKHKSSFPLNIIINYYPNEIPELFLQSKAEYISAISKDFFKNQTLTKQLAQTAFKTPNKNASINYSIYLALCEGTCNIENTAFTYLIKNYTTLRGLARHHYIDIHTLCTLLKNIRHPDHFNLYRETLCCIKLDIYILSNLHPKQISDIVSKNTHLTDSFLMKLHNSDIDVHWSEIVPKINITRFPKFASILVQEGQINLVNKSIENLIRKKDFIPQNYIDKIKFFDTQASSINYLKELGCNPIFLNYCKGKIISELDLGMV